MSFLILDYCPCPIACFAVTHSSLSRLRPTPHRIPLDPDMDFLTRAVDRSPLEAQFRRATECRGALSCQTVLEVPAPFWSKHLIRKPAQHQEPHQPVRASAARRINVAAAAPKASPRLMLRSTGGSSSASSPDERQRNPGPAAGPAPDFVSLIRATEFTNDAGAARDAHRALPLSEGRIINKLRGRAPPPPRFRAVPLTRCAGADEDSSRHVWFRPAAFGSALRERHSGRREGT